MTVALPKVQPSTINSVTNVVIDSQTGQVNSTRLKQYVDEIADCNPEVVKYISRATKLMTMTQNSNSVDPTWLCTVSLVLLYKMLEQEYVKSVAETN